jgi:hypothetical protein
MRTAIPLITVRARMVCYRGNLTLLLPTGTSFFTVSIIPLILSTHSLIQVRTQNFSLGRGLTLRLYIIYVWFQNYIIKSCFKYNISLFETAFIYIYIYIYIKLDVPWLNHSVIYSGFFNFINLFFNILMYYQSSPDFSGWFRLEWKSLKTFDIIIPTNSVFF